MKALFISHSAAPSGAELSMLRLLKSMTRVRPIALFGEDGPMIGRFEQARVPVIVSTSSRVGVSRGTTSIPSLMRGVGKLLQSGWALAEHDQLRDVDVIIARSIKSLVMGLPLARRLGKPLVWSVHDRISADYLGATRARAIRAFGWVVADAFVANSQATLETIRVGKKPHTVIYPGVDLSQFAPDMIPPAAGEHDSLVVVNAGRLADWKGQHVFLEAFDRAFPDTNATAVVVGGALFGEQEYAARLEDQRRGLNSADRIRMVGHADDVRTFLSQADIIVHSSIIPEPFGSVIVEGMAMGKAVIATTPGGPEEIINHGQDGLLIPGNDVEAMAAAMKMLAGDDRLRQQLGRQALQRAEEFSVTSQARRMESWLESWVS